MPLPARKKRRLGSRENSCSRRKATRPHEVWALDFLMDTTEACPERQRRDGRRLKFFTIVDEYSRYCLSIKVARSLTSTEVIAELERLMTIHGPPQNLRSDNGPEFILGSAGDAG